MFIVLTQVLQDRADRSQPTVVNPDNITRVHPTKWGTTIHTVDGEVFDVRESFEVVKSQVLQS